MTDSVESIEEELKIVEAQTKLQKAKNELEMYKDGTFEHFLYGLVKIIDNPLLLLLCIMSLIIGILLGGWTK